MVFLFIRELCTEREPEEQSVQCVWNLSFEEIEVCNVSGDDDLDQALVNERLEALSLACLVEKLNNETFDDFFGMENPALHKTDKTKGSTNS